MCQLWGGAVRNGLWVGEREGDVCSLLHMCHSLSCANLKSGTDISIKISHTGHRNSNTWTIILSLCNCVSRNLDEKENTYAQTAFWDGSISDKILSHHTRVPIPMKTNPFSCTVQGALCCTYFFSRFIMS